MSLINCPKCGNAVEYKKYETWQIVVAILFFPIGLAALFIGKKAKRCASCGHLWE